MNRDEKGFLPIKDAGMNPVGPEVFFKFLKINIMVVCSEHEYSWNNALVTLKSLGKTQALKFNFQIFIISDSLLYDFST